MDSRDTEPVRTVRNYEGRDLVIAPAEAIRAASKRFESMRSIEEQMPQGVPGGFMFADLAVICDGCGRRCQQSRGTFTYPVRHVMCAELLGFCHACNFLTPGRLRLQHRPGQEPLLSGYSRGKWHVGPLGDARLTVWKQIRLWWAVVVQRFKLR